MHRRILVKDGTEWLQRFASGQRPGSKTNRGGQLVLLSGEVQVSSLAFGAPAGCSKTVRKPEYTPHAELSSTARNRPGILANIGRGRPLLQGARMRLSGGLTEKQVIGRA